MDGMDVMSSSEAASNPDPDLHPEPESASSRSEAAVPATAEAAKLAMADESIEQAPEGLQ